MKEEPSNLKLLMYAVIFFLIMGALAFLTSCAQLRHGNSSPFMSGFSPNNKPCTCGTVAEDKYTNK
jgi:hypothetical protein